MALPPRSVDRCAALIALSLLALMLNVHADEVLDDTTTVGIVNLLVSERADEAARGESSLAARRSFVITELLEAIRSGDVAIKGRAAARLGVVISPWSRGEEASRRGFGNPLRPVERVPQIAEGSVIRQDLRAAISNVLDQAKKKETSGYLIDETLSALCDTLGEVANDETIDWAVARLKTIPSLVQAEPLFRMVNSYLGMPLILRGSGSCGLSPASVRDEVERANEATTTEAARNLASAWRYVRPMSSRDRIAFAIKSWKEDFFQQDSLRSAVLERYPQKWLYRKMEPLIRYGTQAVAMFRAEQSLETNLATKGAWEVVIATISGQEDVPLVDKLFAGYYGDGPLIACDIIAASKSTRWRHELEEFLVRLGHNDTSKVCETLVACHRDECIPALERAALNKDSYESPNDILTELAERAKQGPKRRMCRYEFFLSD